jgi:hypothetical protein
MPSHPQAMWVHVDERAFSMQKPTQSTELWVAFCFPQMPAQRVFAAFHRLGRSSNNISSWHEGVWGRREQKVIHKQLLRRSRVPIE